MAVFFKSFTDWLNWISKMIKKNKTHFLFYKISISVMRKYSIAPLCHFLNFYFMYKLLNGTFSCLELLCLIFNIFNILLLNFN